MKKAIKNWVTHLIKNEGMQLCDAFKYVKAQLQNPEKVEILKQVYSI